MQPLSLVLFPRHFLLTAVNLTFDSQMKKSFIFFSAELLNKDVDDLSLDNGFSSPQIIMNHFFDKSLISCKIKFKNLFNQILGL